jgi:glucose/arabinose dehydrogenase
MRTPAGPFVLAAVLVFAPSPAGGAADPPGLDAALADAVARAVGAARGIVLDDRDVVIAELAAARDEAGDAAALAASLQPPAAGRRLRRGIDRFRARMLAAQAAAADLAAPLLPTRESLLLAARAGQQALRLLPASAADGFSLRIPNGGFRWAGRTSVVRLVPGAGGFPPGIPTASVANDGPGTAIEEEVEALGPRAFRLRFGPDRGSATLSVTLGAATRTLRLFNKGPIGAPDPGPGWGLSGAPPASLAYPSAEILARAGALLAPRSAGVTGGHPAEFAFSVDPPLPAGLSLDPATGAISGTPGAEGPAADHTVTVSNLHGSAEAVVRIEVSPALPAGVISLADGFAAERWLDGLPVPVKMAVAPDGRLFFNELVTGNVRVVAADGSLVADPFATVAVQTGAERGLLGLALDPAFGSSGYVYVYAVVPAAGPKPVRGQVIRFTASGDVGTAATVLVDDLPADLIQNGGDLQFRSDGNLYLSLGDTGDSSLSQSSASLAGKVLRYAPDGSIPADNPDPASPEWCRGLRNTFDMAVHPGTGGLFGSENGPTFGDELNFLLPGKNYGWETLPMGFPLNLVGPRITQWTPVIVPTGIAFHSGANFGPGYADNLFLASYDRAEVRRLVLSGAALTDLDSQASFVRWDDTGGVDNKPLDVAEGPGGVLLVSTFTSIWRIDRYGARNP